MTSAVDVLDAIALKYSTCALLREVSVTDQHALAAREHCRRTGDYSTYPGETVWLRRIDGLLLEGTQLRTAIEVKVSRADFLRESDAKRDPWRRITNRFVYATPKGLLSAEEIPDGCGLWEVEDGDVRVAVRARINRDPDPVPHQVLVNLAYRLKTADVRGGVDLAVTTDASALGEDRARIRQVGAGDPSIVRALTADFHDHSRPGCGCGERAGSSHSSAQAPATGDVAGAPKPTQQ
ncbi:hypothetical protein SEA_CRATER_57 [Gordonia phage Crater]|uniref:Uncharacterized protein n=1 Tax=Gordonia phage Apricot TaxID=2250319 RepID=A0A345L164_9CAUD|nr:DNA repair protein [Gordonia phage Apricot]AXH49016.1 hypothetical protein SEA_APRICOT_57 [Gordonia phage Apricot]WNM69764.1 hypothetical protein SEA_CRATER_57 [Gordonia phage Crater]